MLEERLGAIGNARYRGYVEDIHQSGLYALACSTTSSTSPRSRPASSSSTSPRSSPRARRDLRQQPPASGQARAHRAPHLARPESAGIVADRRRLKQILLNLLSNAIKFTNAGGQVIVSATLTEGGELRLRVHDSGVGMTQGRDRLRHAALSSARHGAAQTDRAPASGFRSPRRWSTPIGRGSCSPASAGSARRPMSSSRRSAGRPLARG